MFQKIVYVLNRVYSYFVFNLYLWGKMEKQKILLSPDKKIKYMYEQKGIGDFQVLVPIMIYKKLKFICCSKVSKHETKEYEVIFLSYC